MIDNAVNQDTLSSGSAYTIELNTMHNQVACV